MGKVIRQIMVIMLLVMGFIIPVKATDPSEEIKVGYVPDYGTLNSDFSEGSEGYGYEYLTKLIQHMEGDYTLDFVACTSWDDALEKLACGEVDLLGPTVKRSDPNLLYSADEVGHSTYMLATLDPNSTSLEGATIGVPDYYSDYHCLTQFLEDEGITANIVTIPSLDLKLTMGLGNIDYVMMTSSQSQQDLTVVTGIKSHPIYWIGSTGNAKLMDKINSGIAYLKEVEPYLESQLALKYSSYNYTTNAYISESNLAVVHEKATYHVGIRDFHSPLIREGADGALEGIAFVVLNELSEKADVSFEFVMLDEKATQADYDSVDFAIAATDRTSDLGFPYTSSAYLDLPLMLIEHREDMEGIESVRGNQTIGVVEYYRMNSFIEHDLLYDRKVVTYDMVEQLQDAFDLGEVDCMLVTIASLNMVRDDFETKNYIATDLEDNLEIELAFSKNLSWEEIIVFNKLITSINQDVIEAAILEYTIPTDHASLQAAIIEDPWIIFDAMVILVIAILVTAVFFLVKRRREVAVMLNVDAVTGIMTERKFIEEARRILKEDREGKYRLVVFDIDNFKYINELYGYEIGSKLLRILAQCADKRSDTYTKVARGNADRFMVLSPLLDREEATKSVLGDMEFVQQSLQELIGKAYKLYFSMGVYEILDRDHDITVMIDYANIARKVGKKKAGNSMTLFSAEMQNKMVNNNYFTSIMEEALAKEEFVLYYQPKVLLSTGELHGAEVLIRWQRAAEYLPPYQFIPLFEKNGFIEEVDYYMLRKVCTFLKSHEEIMKGRVSVNISGVTMLQERVVQNIIDIVAEHGIDTALIDLEITETAFVDTSFVLEKIQELRGHGFTISMDDFGAGVSSLNRLKNIHVDTLKIDREFIMDALENPRGYKILESVVKMARDLEIETVAEGIETAEQATLLKDFGCEIGQGYYYARPMQEDQFVSYCMKS